MKKRTAALFVLICMIFCAACESGAGGDVVLISLEIRRAPDKTEYSAGEVFDKSGMQVVGVFSDKGEREITAYQVDISTLSESDRAVTVSYKGISVQQPVKVSAKQTDTSLASEPVSSIDPVSGEPSSDEPSSDEPPVSDEPSSVSSRPQICSLSVVNPPVKTVYVSGERFDPVGVLLRYNDGGGELLTTSFSYEKSPLSPADRSVTLTYGGASVEIPVTVADGTPMVFFANYGESAYQSEIVKFADGSCVKSNIDLGLYYSGQRLNKTLPDPHKNGVSSFDELVGEVDYHIFYGIGSIVVRMNYDYGDLQKTLDRLYFESDLIGACMSIQGQELSDGYVQIVVKYYGDTLLCAKNERRIPVYLEFGAKESSRRADHRFDRTGSGGITVYNSEQAIYALTHGYKIDPVPDSPAQTAVDKAKQILIACCDDTMTEFEKMYNLYLYLLGTSVYDSEGDNWAGRVLDHQNASDMFSSRLVSFRAEGPLLYGSSACYGYSKALALLLSLEGLDVRRVVAAEDSILGRSQCGYDRDTDTYEDAISVHSYDYVRIDSRDYLIDVTYALAGAAGDPPYTLYRDFCVALTKDQHKLVYKTLLGDKVSESPSYRPGSYTVYADMTYDGEHPCLLKDVSELQGYAAALKAKMTSGQKHCAFCVIVDAKNYESLSAFKSKIVPKLKEYIGFKSCNYYAAEREYGDNTYYAAFFLAVMP